MRLAGVCERMLDEILLLSALRHEDRDLVAGFLAERLCKQFLFLDGGAEQDLPRTGLVVIELRKKRAEHLGRGNRRIGFRKIGAIAPVLPRPEEKHLDAGDAAFVMDGEDVRFLDAGRIDALVALDVAQRGQPSR